MTGCVRTQKKCLHQGWESPGSAGPWRSGKELGFNLAEFSIVLITPSARTQRLEKQGLIP